jgi:hypothetical protein
MNRGGKRMTVLRDEEIKQIYGLPRFTEEQRNTYFALNPSEKQEVTKLRSVKTRVYFILQLGYFKAKKIIFVFEPAEVKADASHILKRYYSEQDECDTNLIFSYYIRNDHQKRILRLMNYQRASEQIRSELLQKAIALVRIHTKPVYVFRELLVRLENRQIVIPGYTVLQNIIVKALAHERKRLELATSSLLTAQDRVILNRLLATGDTLYELTLIKKEPKDFGFNETRSELARLTGLKEFYLSTQRILPALGISNENIKYYASLVGYYSIYKLKRMAPKTAYLYLVCFIANRYCRGHDNLVNSLLYRVNQYIASAKKAAKDLVYT